MKVNKGGRDAGRARPRAHEHAQGGYEGGGEGKGRPGDHEDQLALLPPDVAEGLRRLRDHDEKVARALTDPATAKAFYRDPIGTLRGLGVDIPPAVARYAARVRQPEPQRFSFRLAGGQVVRPRVNVRFSSDRRR